MNSIVAKNQGSIVNASERPVGNVYRLLVCLVKCAFLAG